MSAVNSSNHTLQATKQALVTSLIIVNSLILAINAIWIMYLIFNYSKQKSKVKKQLIELLQSEESKRNELTYSVKKLNFWKTKAKFFIVIITLEIVIYLFSQYENALTYLLYNHEYKHNCSKIRTFVLLSLSSLNNFILITLLMLIVRLMRLLSIHIRLNYNYTPKETLDVKKSLKAFTIIYTALIILAMTGIGYVFAVVIGVLLVITEFLQLYKESRSLYRVLKWYGNDLKLEYGERFLAYIKQKRVTFRYTLFISVTIFSGILIAIGVVIWGMIMKPIETLILNNNCLVSLFSRYKITNSVVKDAISVIDISSSILILAGLIVFLILNLQLPVIFLFSKLIYRKKYKHHYKPTYIDRKYKAKLLLDAPRY